MILFIIFIQNFFLWVEQKVILNDLKFRKLDLLYFLAFMPIFFASSALNNQIIGNIEIILLNGIFLYLLTRNIKTSVVVISILYMIAISVDHIDYVIRPERDIFVYAIVYLLIQIIVCGALYLLMRMISNGRGINKFEYSNIEVIFSIVSLLSYLYLMIFVEIKQDNQIVMFLYNTVIILLMAIVLLMMHFSRVQTLKDKYEIQTKEDRIKSNNQYIHEVERHYNELRTFRHNYQNVLLSLDEYLKTDDVKGLKSYYDDSIKPISIKLNQKHYKLEDLSKIGNKEIKSILFNKLYAAQLLNIDVSFESKSEISQFYTDTLDLTLALGIILDNAIDETKEQKHGQIQVGVTSDSDEINIIVQNTLRANDVPIWKMKKLGFSTKGTDRGVGLNNLDEIMNRNNNLMLETRKFDNYFLQKISIETS